MTGELCSSDQADNELNSSELNSDQADSDLSQLAVCNYDVLMNCLLMDSNLECRHQMVRL